MFDDEEEMRLLRASAPGTHSRRPNSRPLKTFDHDNDSQVRDTYHHDPVYFTTPTISSGDLENLPVESSYTPRDSVSITTRDPLLPHVLRNKFELKWENGQSYRSFATFKNSVALGDQNGDIFLGDVNDLRNIERFERISSTESYAISDIKFLSVSLILVTHGCRTSIISTENRNLRLDLENVDTRGPAGVEGSRLQEEGRALGVGSRRPITPMSIQSRNRTNSGSKYHVFQTVKGDQYIRDQTNTKGHTNHITALCLYTSRLLGGLFITCGEDGTVRTWDTRKEGIGMDLHIPCCSVLKCVDIKGFCGGRMTTATCFQCTSVTHDPESGIIITGCSDGSIHIFNKPVNRNKKSDFVLRGFHEDSILSIVFYKYNLESKQINNSNHIVFSSTGEKTSTRYREFVLTRAAGGCLRISSFTSKQPYVITVATAYDIGSHYDRNQLIIITLNRTKETDKRSDVAVTYTDDKRLAVFRLSDYLRDYILTDESIDTNQNPVINRVPMDIYFTFVDLPDNATFLCFNEELFELIVLLKGGGMLFYYDEDFSSQCYGARYFLDHSDSVNLRNGLSHSFVGESKRCDIGTSGPNPTENDYAEIEENAFTPEELTFKNSNYQMDEEGSIRQRKEWQVNVPDVMWHKRSDKRKIVTSDIQQPNSMARKAAGSLFKSTIFSENPQELLLKVNTANSEIIAGSYSKTQPNQILDYSSVFGDEEKLLREKKQFCPKCGVKICTCGFLNSKT